MRSVVQAGVPVGVAIASTLNWRERGVDAVDGRVLIDLERLVVGDAAEERLRSVRAGLERRRELEDLLAEERHLRSAFALLNAIASSSVPPATGTPVLVAK